MTPESWHRLRADLIRDEGQRFDLYTDTTGHASIGVGHNIEAHGISQTVCDQMLDEDMRRALHDATTQWPWFAELDDVRQRVLLNMVFNIGLAGVAQFRLMIQAIIAGHFDEAATQMLDSLWARQVGPRADRLAHMMLTGCESAPTVIR